MRMRAAAAAAVGVLAILVAVQAPIATASGTPPCANPSRTAASSARTCVNQSPSVYDELKQRLGGDLAKALATEQQLSTAANHAAAATQALSYQLANEEARVAHLQDQVDQLDAKIADLQASIDSERVQVATLARAMYRQPPSFLDIIASSGNLADVLTSAADLVVAGQRAHSLQEKLKSDLAQVQADRDARQTDLDQENATLAQVQSGLDQLSTVQGQLDDLSAQLGSLISQIQTAAAQLHDQPADVTAALAQLVEEQEQQLAQETAAAAWAQANVGAGLALDMRALPTGIGPAGIAFSWPLAGAQMTQGFGPTSFALEPAYGPYAHFHTGVDLAAPLGAPVLAAADGVVVAVGHTSVGYGNYIIVAHGSGVLTLYGHLLSTAVKLGQVVVRTEAIGREGSTGFSTGPHLHFEIRINGQVVNPLRYLPGA